MIPLKLIYSSITYLLLAFSCSHAEPPVFSLGAPTFFGSGCPDGSTMIIPSTDGLTLSVLFSSYIAKTISLTTRHRVSCNMAVPVEVQKGISVGIFKVDYRGNAYVPNGLGYSAQFNVDYFFAGTQGPSIKQSYAPGTDQDIFISDELIVGAIAWSPCGASTNFRVNSAITAMKPIGGIENTQIAIDTIDVDVVHAERYFRYYFTSRECKNE